MSGNRASFSMVCVGAAKPVVFSWNEGEDREIAGSPALEASGGVVNGSWQPERERFATRETSTRKGGAANDGGEGS